LHPQINNLKPLLHSFHLIFFLAQNPKKKHRLGIGPKTKTKTKNKTLVGKGAGHIRGYVVRE
jgi:hypothetical protein